MFKDSYFQSSEIRQNAVNCIDYVESKAPAVYAHKQKCNRCNETNDFTITFVENYQNKGKYSLSEHEFFWNNRIKGATNTQKTLEGELKWKNHMQFYSFSQKNLTKEIECKKQEVKSFCSSQDIRG